MRFQTFAAPAALAGRVPLVLARVRAVLLAAAALAALSMPAAARADDGVVPVLTGGELHWSGSATRDAHIDSGIDETGSYFREDEHSAVSWDTRLLLSGGYADAPAAPANDGVVFATDSKTTLGSGSKHVEERDCESAGSCLPVTTQDCTWTETTGGAGAGLEDPAGRTWVIESMGATFFGAGYSCPDDVHDPGHLYNASLWTGCGNIAPFERDVCGTEITFPDQPREGDAATITEHFDHGTSFTGCGDADDDQCTQSGSSTLTLSCALCVTAIHFQQPDLPGRGWADVAPDGTFDGNKVRVTATIHNATTHAITAPVRFRDLTTQRDLPVAKDGEHPAGDVTVPASGDVTVTYDWDTEGFAWYPPHTADPHHIAVLTPYGGARRDLAVRPKPVLLVHGWNATPATWNGYPDKFSAVRKDWLARAVTGMNTDPWHGNTLVENAQVLSRAIEQLRDEDDAEHVDLVAHSMGGLISRQYLDTYAPDDPDGRPVVVHLVMLGTPNLGSNCANLIGLFGVVGHPSIQLSPEFMEVFNRTVTNTRGTKLSVLAGIADSSAVYNQAASALLCRLPKPNDLVVWRESAFWTIADRGVQDGLDHLSMTSDQTAFANWVEPHLAVTPDGSAAGARGFFRAGATSVGRGPAVSTPPTATAPLLLARSVRLGSHRRRAIAIAVRAGRRLEALLVAPPTVSATLLDPRGRAVARAVGGPGPAGLSAAVRRHGRFRLVLANAAGAAAQAGVGAGLDRDPFAVRVSAKGKKIRVVAPRASAVRAKLRSTAGGRPRTLRLRRRGHGRWSGTAPGRFIGMATIIATGRLGRRSVAIGL